MRLALLVFLFLSGFVNKGFSWTIEPINKKVNLKSRLNIVFLAFDYQNNQDFSEDIDILIQRITKTKPFDEVMDGVGIWQANLLKNEEKAFFKKTDDFPPLKVGQDFLNEISASLKSNYKLIIIDAQGLTSCAELSLPDKLSLVILGRSRYRDSQSFAKGFLHELGHSLGLRDECINCGELCPPGPPNCATTQEEAKEWWGDLVGKVARVNYIRGCCGNKDYIRPVIASFMNDTEKAEDFGPVTERFLRKELGRE